MDTLKLFTYIIYVHLRHGPTVTLFTWGSDYIVLYKLICYVISHTMI